MSATAFKTGPWSSSERQQLMQLIRNGLKEDEISSHLNRSLKGVKRVTNQMAMIPGFNRAMLEGAARRCLLGQKPKTNSKRGSKSARQ